MPFVLSTMYQEPSTIGCDDSLGPKIFQSTTADEYFQFSNLQIIILFFAAWIFNFSLMDLPKA